MSDSTVPLSYRLITTTTTCAHCGHAAHDSQFYSVSHVRSRFDSGITKHATTCLRPTHNLPVERLSRTLTTPYCHHCGTIDLSHLPNPPTTANLTTMPAVAAKPRPTTPPTAAKPKPSRPSIFDLA